LSNAFFERPILNSPYENPSQHWELDAQGQPTQQVIHSRRKAEFITPIPKPKKRKESQGGFPFDEGKGLSTEKQQYETTSVINEIRYHVDQWRKLPSPHDWGVTPETARLLQHWRHHNFSGVRPFFCQVEAVETAIWLTEVAPKGTKAMKAHVQHLEQASRNSNPEILRLALKLATGAGKTTVMAMIIAWQTINEARRPGSKNFTRGKDEQDWSDLVVHAPPLYIQEKVHPKVLIDDLLRRTQSDDLVARLERDLQRLSLLQIRRAGDHVVFAGRNRIN
jgi:type III restriction enzyme